MSSKVSDLLQNLTIQKGHAGPTDPKWHPRLAVMGRFSNEMSVRLDFPSCCISVLLGIILNYQHVPLTLVLYVARIHSKAQIKGFLVILPAARN